MIRPTGVVSKNSIVDPSIFLKISLCIVLEALRVAWNRENLTCYKVRSELHRDKTNKMACAPSKDSDQPGHPPSLIRVFAVRLKKARILSYPLSAQRRLWSDWANAQADLSLRWAHMPFCWFCHNVAHLFSILVISGMKHFITASLTIIWLAPNNPFYICVMKKKESPQPEWWTNLKASYLPFLEQFLVFTQCKTVSIYLFK